ncbi:MAG: endonuclease Q family protein [Thermacetogeniaceae bacterium]
MLAEYYGDLHIHIGCTEDGSPVKVTASRSQTLRRVLEEAVSRKGLDIVGIVDAASPKVFQELAEMVHQGELRELRKGGLLYREKLTLIVGVEVETSEDGGGSAHWLAYFPFMDMLKEFSVFLSRYINNPDFSTQPCHLPARVLLREVKALGGVFFPAHAFTPHKGVYGQCTSRLKTLFGAEDLESLYVLELGLSADSRLADQIEELQEFTFLSNSDAHSLRNIGREFNVFLMEEASWEEMIKAFKRTSGRKVVANYGLNPKLGKYHRTFCQSCRKIAAGKPPVLRCESCGSANVVKGVLDRIMEIADWPEPRHPEHRPPYIYHLPLSFLPGIGEKTAEKLLERFGSEIHALHKAVREELIEAIGSKRAEVILRARAGELDIDPGGGGVYGKVMGGYYGAV